MPDRLGGKAEIGDRVALGPMELIVRETDDSGAIVSAGLVLQPEPVSIPGVPLRRLDASAADRAPAARRAPSARG